MRALCKLAESPRDLPYTSQIEKIVGKGQIILFFRAPITTTGIRKVFFKFTLKNKVPESRLVPPDIY